MLINRFPSFGPVAPVCIACLSLVSGIAGCSKPTAPASPKASNGDHDHKEAGHGHAHDHDLPETYDAAVKAVVKFDETIKNAFAANDKDTAHGPLHEIGDVLEALPKLVEKADMTDEQRSSAKGAIDKLFEAFGAIDATMHDQEGKSYDELSKEIAENIAVLKAACKTQEEEASDE